MKFGINQAISQSITQLSCIQLETPSSRFEIFDGSRLTQPLKHDACTTVAAVMFVCNTIDCIDDTEWY